MKRYFVATRRDGSKLGWMARNRDEAERFAHWKLGPRAQVIEISVVDWRRNWQEIEIMP